MGQPVSAVLAFTVGLVVGSFLNVVIQRLPRGESVVRPRSRCPRCGKPLTAAELVPVVSFVLQHGRCRGCGGRIPWRYPAVELLTAGLLAAVALRHPEPARFAFYGWLTALLVAAAFIDIEHQIIPNRLLGAGLAGGVVLLALGRPIPFVSAAEGFSVAGGLMLLLALASRGGMGGGDVKLAGVIGFFLGPAASLLALLLAFGAGGLVALALLALGRKGRKDAIPFGPYLALGAAAAVLWGRTILDWYAALS